MVEKVAPQRQPVEEGPGVCPVFHAGIELIGRRWNGVILQSLRGRPPRFNQLREQIPRITDAMLSLRLRELEDAGVVERTVTMTRPVEVRYQLTAVGERLAPVLDAVAAWSQDWARQAPRSTEESA